MVRVLGIALLGLLAGAPRAGAGPRITNGVFTSEYPSTGALLLGANPDVAETECSGTLIGCQTFLTAAHCVCDTIGTECQPGGPHEPTPGQLWVYLQHGGVFAVSSVTLPAEYDFPRADVAVLHLSTPVTGIRPTRLNRMHAPATGASGTIVGFGSSGGDDYGLKRMGHITTAPCTPPDPSNETLTCWNFESPLGPPGVDSDTCYADSGGPLFVDYGCGQIIAGVTSGGTSNVCAPTNHSFDADVFLYRDYITTAGGADVGAASCGAMPQAGEPGADIDGASGTVSSSAPEATHSFTVAPGTTRLRIALNAHDDGLANFDLLVRFGAPPTPTTFDCAKQGSGQFGVCDFAAPAAGTWYAQARRITGTGIYQITATTFAAGGPGSTTDGQSCDDTNACTGTDVCGGNNCAGSALPNGTGCDDHSGCTQSDVCTAGTCGGTATLATSCHAPVAAQRARLLIRDDPYDLRDLLTWKWSKGSATTLTDYGSPTTTTPYELCVFDTHAGVPERLLSTVIPPGPAWSAFSRGFRYRDRAGSAGGISSIVLKTGVDGSASINLKAKGPSFTAPTLPLAADPRVIVQLLNGSACFEARYPAGTLNSATKFNAKAE